MDGRRPGEGQEPTETVPRRLSRGALDWIVVRKRNASTSGRKSDQHFAGAVFSVGEGFKGSLDLIQRETVGDQGANIDSSFTDPLYRQREVAGKVRANTRGKGNILGEGIAPSNAVDEQRRDAEIVNTTLAPAKINAQVQCLMFVTDCL